MIASRPSRTRGIAGALVGVAALAGSLAGCGAGRITQTGSDVSAIPGVNVNAGRSGEIALRDIIIAYNGPRGYVTGSSAPLVVRIFNNSLRPVRLTGVSAGEAARAVVLVEAGPRSPEPTPSVSASPTPSASPSPTPSGGRSASPNPPPSVAGPSASPTASNSPLPGREDFSVAIAPASYVLLVPGTGPYLQLAGVTKPITPGTSVNVMFTFDDGSSVVVAVPVGVPATPHPRASAIWADESSG